MTLPEQITALAADLADADRGLRQSQNADEYANRYMLQHVRIQKMTALLRRYVMAVETYTPTDLEPVGGPNNA
jgi:hypothetical protein